MSDDFSKDYAEFRRNEVRIYGSDTYTIAEVGVALNVLAPDVYDSNEVSKKIFDYAKNRDLFVKPKEPITSGDMGFNPSSTEIAELSELSPKEIEEAKFHDIYLSFETIGKIVVSLPIAVKESELELALKDSRRPPKDF